MKYVQKNPLPIPQSGALESVRSTIDAIFDWRYALEKQELLSLYEKGKAQSWNASDLDWSVDVDLERMVAERGDGTWRMLTEVMAPPMHLDERQIFQMQLHTNTFMLSQFLHGEQGALLATAKLVQQIPSAEAKFYAANQVADEARHVEVYHRYLTEKIGISYPVHPSLNTLLDDIMKDSRWDVTFLGMQIMVEGLALAAFGMIRMLLPNESLIQDITARIMGDEARHVAFGVLALGDLYRSELSEAELREREEFIVEATYLLHERLVARPVYERLGWDVERWTEWSLRTPFMRGFRQMMFSKIVPNLKRLGLLRPRVRAAFEKLDLLRFEHAKDSVEEVGITPPEELVQLLLKYLAQPAPTPIVGA